MARNYQIVFNGTGYDKGECTEVVDILRSKGIIAKKKCNYTDGDCCRYYTDKSNRKKQEVLDIVKDIIVDYDLSLDVHVYCK